MEPSLRSVTSHRRREPATSVLYQVVAQHLETFVARMDMDESVPGLPWFVVRELRAFLDCGQLGRGFCRVRCSTCGDELLVAFACKRRGFCPSCGARRMNDLAAHLVDRVLPDVPVRQWVLSLPFPLRYPLAYDPDLCREVKGVFIRAILGWTRRRAERAGIRGGRTGAASSGTMPDSFPLQPRGPISQPARIEVVDGEFRLQKVVARCGFQPVHADGWPGATVSWGSEEGLSVRPRSGGSC